MVTLIFGSVQILKIGFLVQQLMRKFNLCCFKSLQIVLVQSARIAKVHSQYIENCPTTYPVFVNYHKAYTLFVKWQSHQAVTRTLTRILSSNNDFCNGNGCFWPSGKKISASVLGYDIINIEWLKLFTKQKTRWRRCLWHLWEIAATEGIEQTSILV